MPAMTCRQVNANQTLQEAMVDYFDGRIMLPSRLACTQVRHWLPITQKGRILSRGHGRAK